MDFDTEEEIAERLGMLAAHDETLRQALRERFDPLPFQLRVGVVEGLARGGVEEPEVVAWVLSWLGAEDAPGRGRYFSWAHEVHHS